MPIIENNPNILNGTLVFSGTRVPIRNLFDYLVAGDTICSSFPSPKKVEF